jgi:cell division protease FtsH
MSLLPPEQNRSNGPGPDGSGQQKPRLVSKLSSVLIVFAIMVTGLAIYVGLTSTPPAKTTSIDYSAFLSDVQASTVKSVEINQSSGKIAGIFNNGHSFTSQGPTGALPPTDLALLDGHHVARSYPPPSSSASSSFWSTLLVWMIPIGLIALFFVWMSRRAKGQMAGLSGWSRSKARVHVTDRPSTTLADVAGYEGVKQEIAEIVRLVFGSAITTAPLHPGSTFQGGPHRGPLLGYWRSRAE